MTIAQAETLKRDLTDKYVLVQDGVPELRRFAGLTGVVKTVNMNGRALVQFDGPVDISWYDIDPAYLKVVDAPLPKKKAHEGKPAPEAVKTEKPKPAAGGKSPLELARAQGAAGAKPAGEKPAEKKLSPLELARQQGAAGAKPAAAAAPAGEKKLSPLELARQQGAAKAADSATHASDPAPAPAAEAAPVEAEPAPAAEPATPPASTSAKVATPGSTAEIIALARQQGPVKS